MASFVSSLIHGSANKIERTILGNSQKDADPWLALHASPSYHYPQTNCSASNPSAYHIIHSPRSSSPIPTPSTSWASEMSALAEKIKGDVTCTLKGNTKSSQQHVDRHGISQGMKLVLIAADEYEGGNESVALDLYLTGVDKILMALPNKADMNTKAAIREKLDSVEERVGILNLASSNKKLHRQQERRQNLSDSSDTPNLCILSHIGSAISRAYKTTMLEKSDTIAVESKQPYHPQHEANGSEVNSMIQFKQMGQYITEFTVTTAILVKQSPLPDLVSYVLDFLYRLLLWADSQYHIVQKLRDASVYFIKLGLQVDEKYRVHEYISEGLYMFITAGLKAAIAYKEAPRQKDSAETEESRVCSPQKSRASWLWTPRQ